MRKNPHLGLGGRRGVISRPGLPQTKGVGPLYALLVAGRVFQALARCRIPGYHAGLSVPRQPGQPALAQRQVDLLYQVL